MAGHYPRRGEDKDTSVTDSFRQSAAGHAGEVSNSKGPLTKLLSDIAGGAGDLGGRVWRGFGGLADAGGPPEGGRPDAGE
jgi:hypothetical protein